MKHLFMVNPKARKLVGRVDEVVEDIRAFFLNYQQIQYDIHITRWRRDAEGFVRRYVDGAAEIVRVYAVGGTGTLFEVINGVVGLPNVQVTLLPFGVHNSLLHYFGKDAQEWFRALSNLVFSRCVSLDLIRCGNKFGVSVCLIGLEALAFGMGQSVLSRLRFLPGEALWGAAVYLCSGWYYMTQKKTLRHYRLDIDGSSFEGEYLNILIANQPHYGVGMRPAVDARLDDGVLDIYIIKPMPFHQRIACAFDYVAGRYAKWPCIITHYRGKRVSIVSDVVMPICFDGEMFFDTVAHVEAVPHALDFAGPAGIGASGGREA